MSEAVSYAFTKTTTVSHISSSEGEKYHLIKNATTIGRFQDTSKTAELLRPNRTEQREGIAIFSSLEAPACPHPLEHLRE